MLDILGLCRLSLPNGCPSTPTTLPLQSDGQHWLPGGWQPFNDFLDVDDDASVTAAYGDDKTSREVLKG